MTAEELQNGNGSGVTATPRVDRRRALCRQSAMPTPDWRAEKSAALIKQICHALHQARGKDASGNISLSRGEFGALLWNATKLYCDAKEEANPEGDNTWSPELPEYLLDHPDKCEETLGLVGDKDYRDPYYDGMGEKRKPGDE
jgi:hypothetical protein